MNEELNTVQGTGSAAAPAKRKFPKLILPSGGWKAFLFYGVVWGAIFLTTFGGIKTYRWVRDQVNFWKMIVNPDQWIAPVPPRGKMRPWIRKLLPRVAAEDRAEVAAVFTEVADMLRGEEITTTREAFAETIARLQPVAPRAVWNPFLLKLGYRLRSDLEGASPEEMADTFEEVARAIREDAASPFEEPEGPDLALPTEETPGGDDAPAKDRPKTSRPVQALQEAAGIAENPETKRPAPTQNVSPGGTPTYPRYRRWP